MTAPTGQWVDAGVEVAQVQRGFMTAASRLDMMYALSADYNRLVNELEKPEPEQDIAVIEAEMERLASDITRKAYGVAVVITELEKLAERRKAEVKRLSDTAKAFQGHADRLRAYALVCMQSLGLERLETGVHTLSVRQNPGRVEVVNAADVPSEFNKVVITTSVDKVAVMQAFKKDGVLVPGTEIVKSERLELR